MAQPGGRGYYFDHVVLQPTTFCNLTCSYCYLPQRHALRRMEPLVIEALLDCFSIRGRQVRCVWHGGEPLTVGLTHFRKLVEPLEDLRRRGLVRHSIQTNGSLIDDDWCNFFREFSFSIGVSLDGPPEMNGARRRRSGQSSFEDTIGGINALRRANIEWAVIVVVNRENLHQARDLYKFFLALEPQRLNFNIEEREGIHRDADVVDAQDSYQFWRELFREWQLDPRIRVREFDHALTWMATTIQGRAKNNPGRLDVWPTVAYNGDIFLFSPEFMAVNKSEVERFCVGNVIRDDLQRVVDTAIGNPFVAEFEHGVSKCARSCAYFDFCRGGHASNKYYETGSLDATETNYCRNGKIALIDAILDEI
jgi:uncharacterized protein